MIASSKARKQRIYRYNAPMHARQHFAHAHISKELAGKMGIKTRNIQIRKGDTVKVMSGGHKGKTGKIVRVDLRKSTAQVEGISAKNARGKELLVPIHIPNLYITDLNLSDKLRSGKIERAKVKK